MDNKNTRRDRFKRLAPKRTNAVLKSLNVLAHCANKNAYEYSEEEINKIFSEIDKRVRLTKAKYQHNITDKEFKF